jgi:hypothetical protein
MKRVAAYRAPYPGTQPNHLHPPYASSIKRAPTKPQVPIPCTLSEVTGPSFGTEIVAPKTILPVGMRKASRDRPVRSEQINAWYHRDSTSTA